MSDAVTYCGSCGKPVASGSAFCGSCGARQQVEEERPAAEAPAAPPVASRSPQPAAPAPVTATRPTPPAVAGNAGAAEEPARHPASPPPPPPPPTATGSANRGDAPAWLTAIPVELWLVIGAFAIPGAWLVVEALRFLPDTLSLLGEEFFGFRIGLALTLILVMVGLIGAGMIAIAWMLYRLDRVGRGLAYVVAGSVILSVIFGGSDSSTTTTAETIAAVTAAVGAAILAFSPAVQRAFTGAESRFGDAATSVVIARTAILVFAALGVLVGCTYVLVGTVESKYVIFGALILVAAVLAWVRSQPLMDGDRLTRQQISIAAAVLVLLMIVIGRGDTGLNFPIGLLVGAVAFLWIPPDARKHFGDAPLDLNLNR